MKETIEQLYLKLTQQARTRFGCLKNVIPVDKKAWKPAPTRAEVLELGALTAKPITSTAEVKHDSSHEEEFKRQELRLKANIPSLKQDAANLNAIIPILKKDKSKHLKPILESIAKECNIALEENRAEAKATFNQTELTQSTGLLVASDLKQLRGFQIGISTLQTLATIYGAELKPAPKDVLSAIETEYKMIINPPHVEAYRRGMGMGMGMVFPGFPI